MLGWMHSLNNWLTISWLSAQGTCSLGLQASGQRMTPLQGACADQRGGVPAEDTAPS
jgi:hypothetical protein